MDTNQFLRLLPTMPMLEDCLIRAGFSCRMYLSDEKQSYRGIRLYHQQELRKDVLYLLRPAETNFPFDDYAYLSTYPYPGKANHLIFQGNSDAQILDQVLEIFSQFQSWEDSIDLLVYRNASLQELCELGARLLENPMFIHDDWFVMMAMTKDYVEAMEPEYLMSSNRAFVPRVVVEDFQNDNEYLETYAHHDAQLWSPPGKNQDALYVNLWDGSVYKGRLLIAKINRDFRPQDYLLAEVLTQRAVQLLRRKKLGEDGQNMDNIVFDLLQGKQTESSGMNLLMSMLQWQKSDPLLCLRIKPQQQTSNTMTLHLLHSDLFRAFPGSYVLMGNQEQCVIINLKTIQDISSQIRHQLAPLCRDYCLYAGISIPVGSIQELNIGYYQAGAALDHAFRLRSEKWIVSFRECALQHILNNLPPPLSPGHLVSPELLALRDYDREKGTQYFETLREYLLQERDIPRTSETLIIHRTTLLYRLKKIQSFVPINLDDPWQRLYLMLSLWILEGEANTQGIV